MFDLANVKRALKITFRRRRFGLRKYVLVLAVLFMLEMFLIEGRGPRLDQSWFTFKVENTSLKFVYF